MRWSIIRTIWLREMRDQLRDRRTLFMMLGLPLILYPVLGVAVLRFALGFTETPSVVGVVTGSKNAKDFPRRDPPHAGLSVMPLATGLAAAPLPMDGLAHACGAFALVQASHLNFDYPSFIESGEFAVGDGKTPAKLTRDKLVFLEEVDVDLLHARKADLVKVDLILEAPADFFAKLDAGADAQSASLQIKIRTRPDDDRSRLALRRITPLLDRWKQELTKVRLARHGLTEQFLEPFETRFPDEPAGGAAQANVINMVVRIFPFMLVMWSLAGALYPAVDLCAGEKERGTMETLLITPAGREEIVVGKFLTIWIFSSGTALLNLLSMGITTAMFSGYMPHGAGISAAALFWCVVLSLPQSAFFSALGLAIGAYARSSKEGQYYLMPLFVVTMPLIFLTLAPGVELNALYSLVPVTGVALLMQKLMTAASLMEIPWAYFVPVLGPIGLYSWLALRWAIEQFNREDVLFREAERLDIGLWFRHLLQEKEPLPTTGQAYFCLVVLIGLRWLSLGFGNRWSLEMHTAISQVAFVAMPALFMVIILNTQPANGLYLRWPGGRDTVLAVVLALLLLAPLTWLTQTVVELFPQLMQGTPHPLIAILQAIHSTDNLSTPVLLRYLLAFALVPALCEEIAFRGFVLRGLHARFRPRNAVLLSSFFFALFHMNVFLLVPTFVLGVVLGLLTVRSKSLLPAICFHLLYNSVLIALIPLSHYSDDQTPRLLQDAWPWLTGLSLAAAAALVWWLYRKPYVDLARREAAEAARG